MEGGRASASNETSAGALALDLRELHASYREGGLLVPVLAGVSFSVAAGEFVAVLGPSGSGKSTLLDLIAGLGEPDAGTIAIDGAVLSPRARLGRSAYMHQRDLLLPWRTVVENAALGLEARGTSRKAARAAARARLPEFDLAEFGDAYPGQLSGGMRQRVAFLRTVLPGQPILLLDEPFGALDALTRVTMQAWLAARLAGERRSVLLVTHDVEEAILLADRVVVFGARPAQVVHIEPIALARPRARAVVTSPAFVAHKAALLAALGLLAEAAR